MTFSVVSGNPNPTSAEQYSLLGLDRGCVAGPRTMTQPTSTARCFQKSSIGPSRADERPTHTLGGVRQLPQDGPVARDLSIRGRFSRPLIGVGAFTLLELLIVVGIIGLLMVLIAPAFTTIKGGTDVTSAAYTIKGVLDTARTYAKANNTYTWVGFYEEDVANPVSPNPDTPAVGRIIISIVASKDGTMLYSGNLSSSVILDGPPNQTALLQVGKLTKIDNVHLKTFLAATATPPPDSFDTRPAATSTAAQIGDTTPPSPALTFHYPVGTSPANMLSRRQFSSARAASVLSPILITLQRGSLRSDLCRPTEPPCLVRLLRISSQFK